MNLKEIFNDDPDVLKALKDREQMEALKEIYKATLRERIKDESEIVNVKFFRGEKGDKGDTGEQGIQGIVGDKGDKGDRGISGKNGRDGIDGTNGKDGANGIDGKAGTDASVDLEEVYDTFIKRIIKEKPIDISQIRNANSFMFGGKRYKIEELMHGGGSGSTTSGKSVTTQYILTAVQSGSDVTIDLTQLSHYATFDTLIAVYRNNVPQTQGANYNFTATATTVTIFNADASEIYNLTYSFT